MPPFLAACRRRISVKLAALLAALLAILRSCGRLVQALGPLDAVLGRNLGGSVWLQLPLASLILFLARCNCGLPRGCVFSFLQLAPFGCTLAKNLRVNI